MSVRRQTTNRLTLLRHCETCGKAFTTTADTPFVRQMPKGVRRQATVYFCSEICKQASYKHLFDGKAHERRLQKDRNRDKERERERGRYIGRPTPKNYAKRPGSAGRRTPAWRRLTAPMAVESGNS